MEYLLPHSRHMWFSPTSIWRADASEDPIGLTLATLSVPDEDPDRDVGGERSPFSPWYRIDNQSV